jgi:ferredoxin-like protein FixX
MLTVTTTGMTLPTATNITTLATMAYKEISKTATMLVPVTVLQTMVADTDTTEENPCHECGGCRMLVEWVNVAAAMVSDEHEGNSHDNNEDDP